MRLLADLRVLWAKLSRSARVFVVTLAAYVGLTWAGAGEGLQTALEVILVGCGLLLVLQAVRWSIRTTIWRLRNRLIVAYLFMALVPILLIGAFTYIAAWVFAGQLSVYLVRGEFSRRIDTLDGAGGYVLRQPDRAASVPRIGGFLEPFYPGLEIATDGPSGSARYPSTSRLKPVGGVWAKSRGLLARDGTYYGWINLSEGGQQLTMQFPISPEFLASLSPEMGEVSILNFGDEPDKKKRRRTLRSSSSTDAGAVPAALNSLDGEVIWGAVEQVAVPDSGPTPQRAFFTVRTRMSSALRVLFSEKIAWDNSYALLGLRVVGGLFIIVELIALVIGISLSRSITNAVHALYEGTERVMEGDFSHRIRVKGRDQLASLSSSFNRMTENLESLLKVAKEKERYEAELEIAREIQKQLYPRSVPASPSLKLTALYKPARMVSGDYYDYRRLQDGRMALAIGDVAGKGISAALLMATVQSGFRSELRHSGDAGMVSTSAIVSQLNQQLHANTPPEKFATFFLGIYDEETCRLTYTNAGHLQPILVRDGKCSRLEVDGMVIGAFPFARYGESTVELAKGDLVLLFTDGISEPENEYGEMFGEDRLADLVVKHASTGDAALVDSIIEAVERWTGSPELQDDMTLLLIRRV